MPLPKTEMSPPFNITRASHIVLTSRDPAKARDFYVEAIGLIVSDEHDGAIYLRGIEELAHHCLVIKKADGQPMCERVGFRVFTDEDLDKAKAHFDRSGNPAKWVEVPHQGRTLHVYDRAGTPLELCATMETRPRMHMYLRERRGAGARRLDHYQVLVPDVAEAAKFYTDLGFRVSDYIVRGEEKTIAGIFLHRKDNPWDMVFLSRDGPRFHHVGYIVESFNDIFRAADCAAALGMADALERGPGRHGATHEYFSYMRDPDGHRLELLLPPIQVIDYEDGAVEYEPGQAFVGTAWGQPVPQSWVEQASHFPGVTIRPPIVQSVLINPSHGKDENVAARPKQPA